MKQNWAARSLALMALLLVSPAVAQDATLKVYESTFNELAAKISFERTGRMEKWFCSSSWTATVTNVRFDIEPSGVKVTGDVTARWCGLDFAASLDTKAHVSYDSAQNAILVTVESKPIRPKFELDLRLGSIWIPLPTTIDVGPTLTFTLPVTTGVLSVTTRDGPRIVRLSLQADPIVLKSGYLELQGDVLFW